MITSALTTSFQIISGTAGVLDEEEVRQRLFAAAEACGLVEDDGAAQAGPPLNRKNVLFAGHDQGAENWARIASLVETCKLNGVDPQAHFTDVLTKLVNLWPASRIDELANAMGLGGRAPQSAKRRDWRRAAEGWPSSQRVKAVRSESRLPRYLAVRGPRVEEPCEFRPVAPRSAV
jgi:IS66 C-terminal element